MSKGSEMIDCKIAAFSSAPSRIRTCDPRIRSPRAYIRGCWEIPPIYGVFGVCPALVYLFRPTPFLHSILAQSQYGCSKSGDNANYVLARFSHRRGNLKIAKFSYPTSSDGSLSSSL